MYQRPDFVKVDVRVKDTFAAYGGCHEHDAGMWINEAPCEGKPDATYAGTFTTVFPTTPWQCFTGNTSL